VRSADDNDLVEPVIHQGRFVPALLRSSDLARLQRTVGNRTLVAHMPATAPSPTMRTGPGRPPPDTAAAVLQRAFLQNVRQLQESHHGGIKSQYDSGRNVVELHVEPGANAEGRMIPDFLAALWEARDALSMGWQRAQGGLFMRPGGAQVLKMTMEMLGEALGRESSLALPRRLKELRKQVGQPLGVGIQPKDRNDTLDSTVVPEHLGYRDSLIGAAGVTMAPIGRGTSGGTEDMLPTTANAAAERAQYDQALNALTPLMSLAVTLDLNAVNGLISKIESQMTWWQLASLRAKSLIS